MATTELALLSLTLGIPVTLVAIALLANAYVAWRGASRARAGASLAAAAGSPAPGTASEAAEAELVAELSAAIDDLRQQLAGQREALGGMLSGGVPVQERVTAAPLAGFAAGAAGAGAASYASVARTIAGRNDAAVGGLAPQSELALAIDQLAREGLSDRAIARELRVGLEEVRIARERSGRSA